MKEKVFFLQIESKILMYGQWSKWIHISWVWCEKNQNCVFQKRPLIHFIFYLSLEKRAWWIVLLAKYFKICQIYEYKTVYFPSLFLHIVLFEFGGEWGKSESIFFLYPDIIIGDFGIYKVERTHLKLNLL